MAFDDLTITGNYSDYYILEEEKEAITENENVWVKPPPKNTEMESTVNSLQ